MSIKKLIPFALAGALVFNTAACGGGDDDNGGDPGTGPTGGSNLTTTEFSDMMQAFAAISSIGYNFGAFVGDQQTSPMLAAQSSQTYTINETADCPAGGTAGLSGTMNFSSTNNNQNFTYDISMVQTYNSCRGQAQGGVWTFNGNPNITTTYSASLGGSGQTYTLTGTQRGGFRFTSPGNKGGSCNIDVTITINYSQTGSYSGRYAGSVCGQSVDQTYSYGT